MSGQQALDCERIRRAIDEYVVADIAPDDAHEVEEHLQLCAKCRKYWSDRREIWRRLSSVEPPRPSRKLIDSTVEAVTRAIRKGPPVFERPVPKVLLAAAAMAISFSLGVATSSFILWHEEQVVPAVTEAERPSVGVARTPADAIVIRRETRPVTLEEEFRKRVAPGLRLPPVDERRRRRDEEIENVSFEPR